jgi:ATP-dependent exoDNAse (exonuclease V) beta subunit
VKVQFLNNDEDQKWKEKALDQLPSEIDQLREQGFALKDIAILVRTNKEAAEVAERLLAYAEQHPESPYRYDIISNEALQIGKAQAVKAVIAMMRHFQHPNDNTRRMMAHYEYLRFHERTTPEEAIRSYTEETNGEFPDELQARFKELATLPLYEMIESFFALSVDGIDEMENAHVQAFLDIALRFGTSRSSDLNSFLEWWDEKGHEKALFSPDSQDAIRLITIHKSKGLGFGAVIMPFLSWNTDHSANSTNIIWCKPKVAPFDRLRIAPLKYEKRLTETIFRGEYLEERLFTYIDNLNMLYVAFTRAKHRLIAFAPQPGKSESISDVATLLWRCINEDPLPSDEKREQVQLRDYFSADEQTLLYGDATPFSKKGIHPVAVTKTGKWQSIPIEDRLQLRLNGIGYFSNDGSRDYGKLMHAIVSDVVTLSDLPLAVDKKVSEGELPEANRDETLRKLQAVLSLPVVADWFDGRYTVLNETQLLHPQWGFRRPDRVMIGNGEVIVADYKFGELEDSKHIRQVQHYLQTIRQMGFGNVKGYLFYMKTGHLLPV